MPDDLDPVHRDLIQACLKPDPSDRPDSARAILETLGADLEPPVGTFIRHRRAPASSRLVVYGLLFCVVAIVIWVILLGLSLAASG